MQDCAAIEVKNLSMTYFVKGKRKYLFSQRRARSVLCDVNLTVQKGTVIAIIGENGAGKTTLLRLIAKLITPLTGTIRIYGNNAKSHESLIGINFNNYYAFRQNFTPRQNLRFYGSLHDMLISEVEERISQLQDELMVKDLLDSKINTLSRGMLEKIGYIKSLIHGPEILLLDEFDKSLDEKASKKMRNFIKNKFAHKEGNTAIIVGTSYEHVCDVADKVYLLQNNALREI